MRVRNDVWSLTNSVGDWPQELIKYREAVSAMRSLDPPGNQKPTNPLCWTFQAAIHGRSRPNGDPDTSNGFWSNCQHGSWFFLAWHRMYLCAFERIVQHFLDDENWSLPYWYAIDPDDESKAVLPPAFRDASPGNELFTTMRSVPANSGDPLLTPLDPLTDSLIAALGAPVFHTDDGRTSYGGGQRDTPAYNGSEPGLLEGVPHGTVHSLVGNDFVGNSVVRRGWMGSFSTAALDPVFWLHHSNIDRLWEVWLNADPSHANPVGDRAWMETTFSFPAPGGATVTWEIGDVLDTAALGYEYESVSAPSGLQLPEPAPVDLGRGGLGLGDEEPVPPPPPQVVGASLDVSLVSEQPVDVALSEPADLGLGAEVGGERLLLRLEGITGTIAAPAYDVYLNVPEGQPPTNYPERRAGTVATFGVQEASRRTRQNAGDGLNSVFDITAVRDALADSGEWDATNLRVAFVPLVPTTSNQAALDEIAAGAESVTADLRASRVVVMVG